MGMPLFLYPLFRLPAFRGRWINWNLVSCLGGGVRCRCGTRPCPPHKCGGQGAYPPARFNCPPNCNFPICCSHPARGFSVCPLQKRRPAGFPAGRRNQISMITGRIMGLRLVVLKRYPLMSFLMADLMAAQSRTRLRWQRSIASKATCRSSVIRSSDSFT